MQFQSNSILMALIAIGLGFAASQALHSSPAQGYPLGAVSLGSNPIDMAAGTASTSIVTVLEASTEHNFVVTDVVLTLAASDHHSCTSQVKLLNSAGTRLGSFQLQTDQASSYSRDPGSPGSVVSHAFSSGLVLAAGDTLTLSRTGTCGALDYTLSGYHAQL